MDQSNTTIEFTGEFLVPGHSGARIEADHFARYKYASTMANSKRILDVACGVGYAGPLLTAAGAASYDGVDINADLVTHAQATYGTDNIAYHVGDIRSFDLGSQYDLITCFETIEHVRDFEGALRNLHRHLHPKGTLLVSSPNRPITSPKCVSLSDAPANKFHTQEFTPRELIATLRVCGFTVDASQVLGQRQRHANIIRRTISRIVNGNPDESASPVPTHIAPQEVSRYFIVPAART